VAAQDANIFYEPLYRELKKDYARLERENQELKAQVAALTARVKELEDIISKLLDTKERYRTSLFGRGKRIDREKKKNRKKKRSTASYSRSRPTDAEVTDRKELLLDTCPQCESSVSAPTDTYTTYVEDIVFSPKQVIEYTIHRHWCISCKKQVRAPIPNCLPGMTIGMNTVLYVLTEYYRYRTPDSSIAESLTRYFGMNISEGEITNIRDTTCEYFGDKYKEIIETIQCAHSVYADETGWKVNGENWQCWYVGAPKAKAVRYIIADTRGKGIIEDALGKDFKGVLTSDFYSAYKNLPGDHQGCWAHILSETHGLVKSQPQKRSRKILHEDLKTIFDCIAAFKERKWTLRGSMVTEVRIRKELLRVSQKRWRDSECQRMANRISTYLDELLTCIRNPDVEPTNNISERGLRSAVIHRHISRGNRSAKGAYTYEVNKSVIETLILEGGDLMEKMKTILWETAWNRKFGIPA